MRELYVDVTAYLARPRDTGIQRVVGDLLRDAAGDRLKLVSFDPGCGEYREFLGASPGHSVVGNTHAKASGRHKNLVRRFLLRIWYSSAWLRQRLKFDEPVNALARRFYSRVFGNRVALQHKPQFGGARVSPGQICLIDIPIENKHMRFLEERIEAGTQLVVYLYDIIPTKVGELWSTDLSRGQKDRFERYMELALRADLVVCLSHFTRSEYLAYRKTRRQPGQRVTVMYPPVRLDTWRPELSEAKYVSSEESAAPKQALSVLAVAPLLRRKNLRVLLLALELIQREQGREIVFHLVCPASASVDPEALRSLKRLKQTPVKVLFAEDVSDAELKRRYQLSDVVAVPSLYEGFGLPVLEALASGTPVLASDIPVFRELSKHVDISLIDPHSPRAWATSLVGAHKENTERESFDFLPSTDEFLNSFRLKEN